MNKNLIKKILAITILWQIFILFFAFMPISFGANILESYFISMAMVTGFGLAIWAMLWAISQLK